MSPATLPSLALAAATALAAVWFRDPPLAALASVAIAGLCFHGWLGTRASDSDLEARMAARADQLAEELGRLTKTVNEINAARVRSGRGA